MPLCGSCLCVHLCYAGVASEWRGTALHVHACHGILQDFLLQIRSAALCPAQRCLCFSLVRCEGCLNLVSFGHSTRDEFLSSAFTLVGFLCHFGRVPHLVGNSFFANLWFALLCYVRLHVSYGSGTRVLP